jgi:hypothetical protein
VVEGVAVADTFEPEPWRDRFAAVASVMDSCTA